MVRRLIGIAAAVSLFVASGPAGAADAKHGKHLFFQHCAICHTVNKGGSNGVGPNLFGVVGTKAAAVAGFNFSPAMKASGIQWTPDQLTAYLQNPAKVVPDNNMNFQGLGDESDAADVVAFLKTQK